MKKIILYIIGFTILCFLPNKPYRELNNIPIIDQITITCRDEYHINLREIIPKKKDNSIIYQYRNHTYQGNDLSEIKNKIIQNNYYFDNHNIHYNCLIPKDFLEIFS